MPTSPGLQRSLRTFVPTISRIYQIPAITVIADVADPQAPQRAVEEVVARLGHVDILINNVGIEEIQYLRT